MKPNDFTDVTLARAKTLLEEHGVFISRVEMHTGTHHLYAVEGFYVECVDYPDGTYDIFAYHDDYRLEKFLRKFDWRDNM